MHTYIVTVTAADRVGIVHSVTGSVSEQGGNIKELSQTVLRGYFTIILAVEFDQPYDPKRLRDAIVSRGERFDLKVAVIPDEGHHDDPVPGGDRFILTVLGQDRPGNIHRIAGSLAEKGVNIVDFHARSDGPDFRLIMEAFLPSHLRPAALRSELEQFGAELGMEVYVQHEDIFLATNEPRPVRVGSSRNPEGSDVVVPH